jgi:FlaA1/EpsC-like NDP-sugar epimerase/lipopolysaccharide/colanic/teichoic acid biosynthesis glycosyltransferase
MSAKRGFDVFFSAIGLVLLVPIFAVMALLIKLDSAGPVFFVQKRVGKRFRLFDLYKFRSMVPDAVRRGGLITADKDPRVTRIGRFLRRTKLDELPQLWNVLKGEMSLVGPRPEVEKYVTACQDDYREILGVRPGITDVASLTYRDEEKVLEGKTDPEGYYLHMVLPEKINLAKEYVRKASLVYDLKIIGMTFFKLIYPHDAIHKWITKVTPYRRPIVIGIQIGVFILSNYLAFFVRFDGDIPGRETASFLKYLPLLVLLRIIFLFVFSLGKGLWRYVGVRDLLNITSAISLGSVGFVIIVRYFFADTFYPRSIYVLDWYFNIFLLGGLRLFRRFHEKEIGKQTFKKRILVIGAGNGAEMLLRDVESNPFYAYKVIGLIDDNPVKKGLTLRSIPILGTRKDLLSIVKRERPDEFLIAIPSISRSEFENIVRDLRQYGFPIKTLPSLWSLLSGKGYANSMQAIEPEDILFRAPACNGSIDLKEFIRGKRVLVTGAGGSIGSELSRQIASFEPGKLILFERHEENLYKIDKALRALYPDPAPFITSVIGDILNERRMGEVMEVYRPHVVFHAAAYKHVPLMEDNAYEAFRTNVVGTRIVAEKAIGSGVERFILVSTDKAVNPVNVMGMTKKLAEEMIYSMSRDTATGTPRFIVVRFGNVLESSGSVVPLFREQIQKGGPVTVTHPEITRYFMTLSEAVRLVLQAAAVGKGGEVFVLDMGKPVKILDLAKRMISLYGYKPGVDIEIVFTGLRPGEKLHEELFNPYEKLQKTSHAKINVADSNGRIRENIVETVAELKTPAFTGDNMGMKDSLDRLIHSLSNH